MGNAKDVYIQLGAAKRTIEGMRKKIRGRAYIDWYEIGDSFISARRYLENAERFAQGKSRKW